MKLLVFAHIPPPHHGQSAMVKLMLDGFGGDCRKGATPNHYGIACYHVDCRVSHSLGEIGEVQISKILKIVRYSFEAIWCRLRYGVTTFYYVPAPGKRAALFRDWIVLLLCRPFFKNFVFHWHAAGLGDWLATSASPPERWIARLLYRRPTMSLALAAPALRDPLWFLSKEVKIIPNGISDPCPDFEETLLPVRLKRLAERREGHSRLEVLFMAHCSHDKGLFDSLEAIALLNQRRISVHLSVAGGFADAETEKEFHERIRRPDLQGCVTYAGFVSGDQKADLFRKADLFCFPTYYAAESFSLVILETLAYGLPPVTTRWRSIPEALPPDYPHFVPIQDPQALSEALIAASQEQNFQTLRTHFKREFTSERHLQLLVEGLNEISNPSSISKRTR